MSSAASVADSPAQLCDDRFHSTVAAAVQRRGGKVHVGRMVSSGRVAVTADEKQRVAKETGAIGLDMESAAIATVATERQIPLGVLRVASDLKDADLPMDFNQCTGPFGWARGAALCLIRPSRLCALMAFRRDVAVATASLTVACREILGREEIAAIRSSTTRCAEC